MPGCACPGHGRPVEPIIGGMKKTNAPFQPTVLPHPCPKCGGQVLLRQWEGRIAAGCQGPGCRFGFDADKRGRALARCPSCGQGRLKTTPKGRVCADCGSWDHTPAGKGTARGICPRCGTGRLSVRKGEYGFFVGCSDLVCGLTYTCDEKGRPEGGHCKACQGPVRKTRAGSFICIVCETWQNPKPVRESRALPPPPASCPGCSAALRAVWTRKQTWIHRCDPCGRWVEVGGSPSGEGEPD